MTESRENYTMGYGAAATAIMAMRTAETHAGFFLPHLKPGMSLLDCGCGPGSVTLGLAEIVSPGNVVGTEIEPSQVALAKDKASKSNIQNVRFETADIYELPFDDASFDAVFISAVLGNLKTPLRGIREAFRVLRDGGVIGVKEFDHGGDIVYPSDKPLELYNDLYLRHRRDNGHDPESGRKVGAYLNQSGFERITMSASYEAYSDPTQLRGAAELNLRLLIEGWGEAYLSRGWATREDIEAMTNGWRTFAGLPGAFFAVAWCEGVAYKPM